MGIFALGYRGRYATFDFLKDWAQFKLGYVMESWGTPFRLVFEAKTMTRDIIERYIIS